MPKRARSYRKRPRTAKRRRTYRRKSNTTLSVQRNFAFSNQQIVYMRYVDNITLNPGLGTTAVHGFRANSIYDPDYSTVGHQPMGRDEWATFYDHYTVLGCTIRATFLSPGDVVNTDSFIAGILLDDDSGTLPNPINILEQGKARTRLVTNSKGSRGSTTIQHYYNPRKFFGVKDMKDNRDMLGAEMSANPSENCHFKVFISPFDFSADVAPVEVLVNITYKVLLTEPKTLVTS